MNKKLSLTLVVILVIAIGAYFFPRTQQVIQNVVGAVSGPDISSPYLSVNGVETQYYSQKFNTASTTRCAIKSPDATSTLSFSSVVRAATTTNYDIAIAKATTAFATTTTIRSETVTANGAVVFPMASTTYGTLTDTDRTFAPNTWLVVSTAGPTATAFDSSSCSVIFTVGR